MHPHDALEVDVSVTISEASTLECGDLDSDAVLADGCIVDADGLGIPDFDGKHTASTFRFDLSN
jgi:hypothetical protein